MPGCKVGDIARIKLPDFEANLTQGIQGRFVHLKSFGTCQHCGEPNVFFFDEITAYTLGIFPLPVDHLQDEFLIPISGDKQGDEEFVVKSREQFKEKENV